MKHLFLLLLVTVAGCKVNSNPSILNTYGFALADSKIRVPNGDVFTVLKNPKWDRKYAGKSVMITGSYRTLNFRGAPWHITQLYGTKVTAIDECTDIEKIMKAPEFISYFNLDTHFKKKTIVLNYPEKNFSHDLDCSFTLPSGKLVRLKKSDIPFCTEIGLEIPPELYVSKDKNSYTFVMTQTNLSLTAEVVKKKVVITSKGVY